LKKLLNFIFCSFRNSCRHSLFSPSETANSEAERRSLSRTKAERAPHKSGRWNGGSMKSISKVLLGTALAAGAIGFTATPAHAARVGIYVGVGAPAAYVPPCPGPGYAWIDGYWAGGYWTPGYWNYVGVAYGPRAVYGPVVRYDRGYYHDHDWDRYRDHRDWDRHYDRDWDHDRFRR
jgi:hypothetical protein